MQEIFAHAALTGDGWQENVRVVVGASGRIVGVTPDSADPLPADAVRVPVLLPALSNLHSHTFQRAMAGLTERRGPAGRDSFWTWREVMYAFLELLSPDDVEAIAAFAFMEMEEAGFAAVAEFHYLHHQPGGAAYEDIGELSARIAAAAVDTGIGLTLLPVFYRHGGVDRRPLAGGQLRFGNDLDSFARLVARAEEALKALDLDAGLGLAPHSLRAAGLDDIRMVAAMRPGAPVHMHIAEQQAEADEVQAGHGARPVAWLLDHVGIDRRWCLIHCTHMEPAETERLARAGAIAGLCPVTEANLGDGIFDGARYAGAGGRFGVGTDSNIRISVCGELRQLEYSQRLKDRARVVLADPHRSAGRFVYDAALEAGALALGRESGTIARGRLADLVGLDPARLAGTGKGDGLLDAWVFSGGSEAVTDLWSAGRHVVRAGRHVKRTALEARYRDRLSGLLARL